MELYIISHYKELILNNILLNFQNAYIEASSSFVGKKEFEGPISNYFDAHEKDEYFGKSSFEEAETEMVRRNLNLLLNKAQSSYESIDLIIGGDLINQCIATSFAISETNVPFLGLYGACSTIIEALICASIYINNDNISRKVIASSSSHFCASERQYRFPLEYGSVRTPTSQNTVTGTGAFLCTNQKQTIRISQGLIGRIVDKGVKDANNMGAAMAGAAVDTICRFFNESNYSVSDFDYIVTGDLGYEGNAIAKELLKFNDIDLGNKFCDCGMLIYDKKQQDTHCGGSGCGCIASVLSSYFIKMLNDNMIKRILAIGTGALLNPNSVFAQRTIPSIAHCVVLERD